MDLQHPYVAVIAATQKARERIGSSTSLVDKETGEVIGRDSDRPKGRRESAAERKARLKGGE